MHRAEQMPIVREGAVLREAIHEMTAKRLGHAGVVNARGELIGVLSDGDLRRALERGGTVVDLPVRDLLRRDPKTVREHALVAGRGVVTIGARSLGAEALAMMERHSITALFVVDRDGRPQGVVHLHDLLKAGVV